MNPTRIKICGITNHDDAMAAAQGHADFLGFILYPPSRRSVNAATVKDIVAQLRPLFPELRYVAVTVDEPVDRLVDIYETTGVDFLQLHGKESPEVVSQLCAKGIGLIKAIPVKAGQLMLQPEDYAADYLLFDTHSSGHGGSGERFDLEVIPEDVAWDRVFLAGGFTPDNICEALDTLKPYAVDVASGVEASPGLKDHTRMEAFIQAVRNRSDCP